VTSDSTHLLKRIAASDWLIAGLVSLLFLFLRWATWYIGLPPLEWVLLAGAMVLFFAARSLVFPVIMLILVTTGSLLGNLIHVFEDGLVPFSLFQVFYILSIAVFVLRWFMTGFSGLRKTGFELELALFFSLIFLSILWTPDAERAFLHAIRIVVLSGLLFLFVNWIHKPGQISLVIYATIGVGSLLGFIAIYGTVTNPIAIMQDVVTGGARMAGRARIGQVDPNVFASLFFLPLAYTASLSFSKQSEIWKRVIATAFFVILLATVLVTFSRSSWVATLVMLLFLAVTYRQFNLFLIAALAAAVVVTFSPEVRYLLMNILNRFIDLFTGGVDTSNYLRIVLLQTSFHIFFDSWLLGVGWRGFSDAFLSYHSLQDTLGVYEPHNVIYLVYTELGLVGLLLFVFIVYKIFKIAWENTQFETGPEVKIISRALLATLIAYAVFYQFIGSGFTDNQLWITTGLAISLNQYLKRGAPPD